MPDCFSFFPGLSALFSLICPEAAAFSLSSPCPFMSSNTQLHPRISNKAFVNPRHVTFPKRNSRYVQPRQCGVLCLRSEIKVSGNDKILISIGSFTIFTLLLNRYDPVGWFLLTSLNIIHNTHMHTCTSLCFTAIAVYHEFQMLITACPDAYYCQRCQAAGIYGTIYACRTITSRILISCSYSQNIIATSRPFNIKPTHTHIHTHTHTHTHICGFYHTSTRIF
jgi:hypothetical protein